MANLDDKKCRYCKHWDLLYIGEPSGNPLSGICKKANEFTIDSDFMQPHPWDAKLITGPDFYCPHFQEKR